MSSQEAGNIINLQRIVTNMKTNYFEKGLQTETSTEFASPNSNFNKNIFAKK